MGSPAEPGRAPSWSRADMATVVVIALAMALHVRFCLLDERPPSDLGHYYNAFRNILLWGAQHGELNWAIVDTPYSLLLAGLGSVVTPSPTFMEVLDGAWLLVLLAGTAFSARAVGGPVAGLVAAIAVAAFPQTHVLARTHWIHHPEAAALVGALALWLCSPGLTRWTQALGVGLLLFFGETIRQTGIPFGVPLALLVCVGAWRSGARAKLLPVVAALVGGLAWHGPSLLRYVSNKAAAAQGYAQSVTTPWWSVVENLGPPVFFWAAALAGVAVVALRRADLRAAVVGMCLVWIAGGVVAVLVFHVGPDNFPISGVALAVLAGMGASMIPVPAKAIAGVGVLAALVVQVPPLLSYEAVSVLPASLRTWANPGPINYLRVYWHPLRPETVLPVVDQVCEKTKEDPAARCFVLASRGLFNPSWEDGGTFALFLADRPRVTVLTPEVLWDDAGRPSGITDRIHGLVDVRCAPGVAPSAGGRFEAQYGQMQRMLRAHGGSPIGTFGDPKACVQTWYVLQSGGTRVE